MKIKVLRLNKVPILKQLQLEEALLRVGKENFLILNSNAPPAVVFGISGKIEEHLETFPDFPVIRRFSGGGTVAVDEETLYISLICNKDEAPCDPYPKQILNYAAHPLRFIDNFQIRENDYAIGDLKFAGNAQSITNKRWVHHSTLLWDYCKKHMNILKIPPTMPDYRQGRSHDTFLTKLKEHFTSKEEFLKYYLEHIEADLEFTEESLEKFVCLPHRKTTRQLKGEGKQLTNTVS